MEKYNIRDLSFEELIELTLEAEDSEDAIGKIGKGVHRKGYVKEGSADVAIKEEELYPTALPTEMLKVTIPRPMERDTVKRSTIIVTKLRIPVGFTLVRSDDEAVSVNIIFALVANGVEHQPIIFQKLVGMFSGKRSMERIKVSTASKEIMNSLVEPLS